MKKLALFMALAACGATGFEAGCDLSRFDGFVGQNVTALDQVTDTEFTVIKSGEVWTGGSGGGQTIVFLDGDRNILSFGCG